jgi:hypothetical protein
MSRASTKWLTVVASVGTLGVGATFGLADSAGASSRTARSARLEATTAITTASFSFSASVSGLSSSTVTVTGTGQANLATHAASLTVDIPAGVAKLIPGGSAEPEVANAVLSGGTVYAEVPSLASLVGEPWISVVLPTKVLHAGILTKVASVLGDVNAIESFAEAHHATVTSLGSATVDGVQATGTKIVATLSHKGKSRTVTASVWANSADQLVQANVSVPPATTNGSLGVTAIVNFTGYNAPVTITVPPASQVKAIPYSTVASLLGKGGRRTDHS